MIRQCCVCKKVYMDGRWVYPRLSQLEGQDVSHGYCDDCHQKQMRWIKQRGQAHWWKRWVTHFFCFG